MSAPKDDAQTALPPEQHADGELTAGRYQIKELIGNGSTGDVYRADAHGTKGDITSNSTL